MQRDRTTILTDTNPLASVFYQDNNYRQKKHEIFAEISRVDPAAIAVNSCVSAARFARLQPHNFGGRFAAGEKNPLQPLQLRP